MSEEEPQRSSPGGAGCLFSVQGPDSSLGWGRAESPPQGDRASGSARPCEGPGRGQAAGEQRGPLTWQEEEGKGPCWAAGEGQRVRYGRPRQRATGIGWGEARSAQDPT